MAQVFFEKQNIKTPIKMEQNKNNASDNRPVTERIKTFEDARRELGDSNPLVFHYDELTRTSQKVEEMPSASDIVAYLKLRIIVAALNEGWEPKFEDGERRWAPFFVLYTNKEMAEMSDEDKKNCRVVGRSAMRMRSAGSPSRVRSSPPRARTRASGRGLPSAQKSLLSMRASSSSTSIVR